MDKEIENLQKQLWWQDMQHKARELYLLRRIADLEKKLKEPNGK